MSIKPEVQPVAQKQQAEVAPESAPVEEVYDDTPEAYQTRRQEALDAAASG